MPQAKLRSTRDPRVDLSSSNPQARSCEIFYSKTKMRYKEFDVVHDRGNQHTKSSIEGSWEKSILVAKPHHAVKQRKDHITGKQQENQCLISTYDLDLNMHLIKDCSDTTVGKRSRKQKNSCLRSKNPRSSKKIACKV